MKSLAFRILSATPGGPAIYRFAQKHITRSIVPTPARVAGKARVALDYWRWISANGHEEMVRDSTHVDFGAGWHPTIPLVFHALGVKRQRLLDLEPVMEPAQLLKLVAIAANTLPGMMQDAGFLPRVQVPFHMEGQSTAALLSSAGMTYHAPYGDLLRTIPGEAGLVTSTQVLLHIPEPVLAACFDQIRESLRPGGLFMATIHLYPLYGGLRRGESAYRHLKYSPERWDSFGSRLTFYTRLKAPDYRRLLEQAGFVVRGWDVTPGTPDDFAALDRQEIHPCFARYSRDDLAARHLFFAAQRP